MLISKLKKIYSLTNRTIKFFSDQKSIDDQNAENFELKIVQQKAYLARQISKYISWPIKNTQQFLYYQIQNQILALLEQNESVEEEAKDPFIQMFKTGYDLTNHFTLQKNTGKKLRSQLNRVIFQLNDLTRKNFSTLNKKNPPRLFKVQDWSGTPSAILYQILNNFIVDYKIQCSNLSWPEQFGQNIMNYSKVIYWPMNIKRDNPWHFKQLLKNQSTPVELQELTNLGYFNGTNKKPLKDYYKQKGIKLKLIIDQFNDLIQLIKYVGYTKKTLLNDDNELTTYQGQEMKRQENPLFVRIDVINSIIGQALKNFNNVIFQSTQNYTPEQMKEVYDETQNTEDITKKNEKN